MVDQAPEIDDKILYGCGLGCLCQVGFYALELLIAINSKSEFFNSALFAGLWGLTQWIAIVPLILRQRARGRPRAVQGLLISGFLGMLLSSACAGWGWLLVHH